jgi:hypothetical protein
MMGKLTNELYYKNMVYCKKLKDGFNAAMTTDIEKLTPTPTKKPILYIIIPSMEDIESC